MHDEKKRWKHNNYCKALFYLSIFLASGCNSCQKLPVTEAADEPLPQTVSPCKSWKCVPKGHSAGPSVRDDENGGCRHYFMTFPRSGATFDAGLRLMTDRSAHRITA